jgi:N-acetylmuramoyl-L-alanine amidase
MITNNPILQKIQEKESAKAKALADAAQLDLQIKTLKQTLEMLVKQMKVKFPDAEIKGHRDFPNVKKSCPSFDVTNWLKTIKL